MSGTAAAAPKDIKWGTGPAGSSGGKALIVLSTILNKNMPEYRISVLPTPGAVGTVKGFATGEFDGYYGSDVALKEFHDNKNASRASRPTSRRCRCSRSGPTRWIAAWRSRPATPVRSSHGPT